MLTTQPFFTTLLIMRVGIAPLGFRSSPMKRRSSGDIPCNLVKNDSLVESRSVKRKQEIL